MEIRLLRSSLMTSLIELSTMHCTLSLKALYSRLLRVDITDIISFHITLCVLSYTQCSLLRCLHKHSDTIAPSRIFLSHFIHNILQEADCELMQSILVTPKNKLSYLTCRGDQV